MIREIEYYIEDDENNHIGVYFYVDNPTMIPDTVRILGYFTNFYNRLTLYANKNKNDVEIPDIEKYLNNVGFKINEYDYR